METGINLELFGSLTDSIIIELSENAATYFVILALLYLISRISALIPVPVRWKHEYEPVEPGMKLKNQLLSGVVSIGVISLSVWVSIRALADLGANLEIFMVNEIYKTPSFIVSMLILVVGILGEICFVILCIQGIILFAQSEPPLPNLPDWVIAIAWILGMIVILLSEILTAIGFAASGIGAGIAVLIILVSVFGFFSTSWLTWGSFPNNWLRRQFCSTFAYWHLDLPPGLPGAHFPITGYGGNFVQRLRIGILICRFGFFHHAGRA